MGFPESEIMDMVGFKTPDMFNRYDITVEVDILRTADEIARRLGINASDHSSVNHAKGPNLAAASLTRTDTAVCIEGEGEKMIPVLAHERPWRCAFSAVQASRRLRKP
jgi:hypothetical protein